MSSDHSLLQLTFNPITLGSLNLRHYSSMLARMSILPRMPVHHRSTPPPPLSSTILRYVLPAEALRKKEIYSRAHVELVVQHGADLFGLRASGNIYSRIGNPTVVRPPGPHFGRFILVLWSLFMDMLMHAPRTSLKSASPHWKAVSQLWPLPVAKRPNSWPSATSRVQVTISCLRHIFMAG